MRNLTPEQARELRPGDLALDDVPEGQDESKLPWSGHVEHEIIQDLASYWEVNSNFKADWVAFILTGGGTEIQSPQRYLTYMAMPEGEDKDACRAALLADLTKQFEGHLASWMLDLKKKPQQPRTPADGPVLLYYAEDLSSEDEAGALRVEITRAIQDPSYTLITNFEFRWIPVLPGHALIANDANREQMDHLREELRKAQEDRDYIPVVNFKVTTMPLRDSCFDDFDEDDVEMLDEIMGDKVEEPHSPVFGDLIPELVPDPTPEP